MNCLARIIAATALLVVVIISGPTPVVSMSEDELTQALLDAPDAAARSNIMEQNAKIITVKYIDAIIAAAQSAFFSDDPELAFSMIETAEELSDFIADVDKKAWCKFNRGQLYYYSSMNDEAMEQYDAALEIYLENGNFLGEANCYRSNGDVYFYTGDIEAALAMYEMALPLFIKAQYPLGEANCYFSQGDVYFYTGDIEAALAMYEMALPLFVKAQYPRGEANCYFRQGGVYFRTGDNEAALAMYEKALPLFVKAQYPRGEANCYYSQGDVYFRSGDNEAALAVYDKALSLYKKTQDSLGEANCYFSQGDVYFRTGDNEAALAMYDKALPLFRKAQEPRGEANCYFSQGDVYFKTGDNEAALAMYDKALPLYIEAQDPRGEANCYTSQGDVYFKTGDNEAALAMYENALPLYIKAQEPPGEANCYRSQGDIKRTLGENEAAIADYERAFRIYVQVDDLHSQMWTQYRMGKSRRALGDFGKALDEYTLALEHGEYLFAHAGGEEMQRGVKEEQVEIYEETADLLLEMGRPEDSLDVLERMRGAVLRGMLERGRIDPLARASDDVRAQAAALTADMNTANNKIVLEMQKPGGGDKSKLDSLRLEHQGYAKQFDMLMTQAAAAYAGVSASGVGTKALGRDAIRAGLDPETLLLEYFIGENRAVVFALTRDSFNMYEVPCDREKISERIDVFYGDIYNAKDEIKTDTLYSCILAPVEEEILDAKLVLIVPDRELHYVPFDALAADVFSDPLFGSDRPYTVVVSGTMYLADRTRAAEHPRDFKNEKVFALGDADFGVDAQPGTLPNKRIMDVVWKNASGIALSPLPETANEVKRISSPDLYGTSALVLMGAEATESNTKARIAGNGIAHFSTHGMLDNDAPMNSALALSEIGARVRGEDTPEDGFLTAREIILDPRIQLDGGLAVLSACQTGRGEMSNSEGIIGMTRAFAIAGARGEIVSLWSVEVNSTSHLFQYFYEFLKQGETPIIALAKAKEKLRTYRPNGNERPPYASPFYWAPFVYVGVP